MALAATQPRPERARRRKAASTLPARVQLLTEDLVALVDELVDLYEKAGVEYQCPACLVRQGREMPTIRTPRRTR